MNTVKLLTCVIAVQGSSRRSTSPPVPPPPQPPSITSGSSGILLNDGTIRLMTANGDTPITWSSPDIDSSLGLTSAGQLFVNLPMIEGSYTFSLFATNGVGIDSVSYTANVQYIVSGTPPTITSPGSGTLHGDGSDSITLSASGDTPIEWRSLDSPSDLVVDINGVLFSNGSLSSGPYSFTIHATNASGDDGEPFDLTVL